VIEAGGRFTTAPANGIVCQAMNELRELRRAISLGQRAFAALLSIPLETYRPWDSGRRVVSAAARTGRLEAHFSVSYFLVAPPAVFPCSCCSLFSISRAPRRIFVIA